MNLACICWNLLVPSARVVKFFPTATQQNRFSMKLSISWGDSLLACNPPGRSSGGFLWFSDWCFSLSLVPKHLEQKPPSSWSPTNLLYHQLAQITEETVGRNKMELQKKTAKSSKFNASNGMFQQYSVPCRPKCHERCHLAISIGVPHLH